MQASSQRVGAEGRVPLDQAERTQLLDVNEALAAAGLRVLAVAAGQVSEPTETALTDLTFLGFLGLADPPAPGVKETIVRLREAGLRTIMVTGDQRLTAEAIGQELGLIEAGHIVRDGRELEREPGAVTDVLSKTAALSRVTPEHKIIVVQALQKAGEVVAMIGDGVNDAPALKQADIGVAMGVRGTDVAKQAASIVLADDRFETIASAVEEGRVIFDNIRKFVFYLFSCNVAEILVLLGAALVGLPLPLLPLQLLWLNLVTDTFPALSLAVEPAEGDVMRRPPRRLDEAVVSRAFLIEVLFYAALITAATLTAFVWTRAHTPARATTVAFMTLALAQIGHLGNARSASAVLNPMRVFGNPFALLGVGASIGLQLAAVSVPPLRRVLHLSALDWTDWVVILALAAIPAVVGQGVKLIASRSWKRTLRRRGFRAS
jgi:Ca2+-transporting ATPase